MRPFSSLLTFALVAALTTTVCQALPASPSQPQKPLAVDLLLPRFAASVPVSNAQAPIDGQQPKVLLPRATDAANIPVSDRNEVINLTGENEDLAGRKEENFVCDGESQQSANARRQAQSQL